MVTSRRNAVAIIPARGGSKRIPGKNIKLFCGKPMIAWSILAAQRSGLFDAVVVSTDSRKIADTAAAWGAWVPFMRPPELSDDFTPTLPVITHAINQLKSSGEIFDFVCCIYATAPFIRTQDLQKGHENVSRKHYNFSFPVTTFPSPIFRALKKTEDGQLDMFWPEHLNTRTQDLPEAYHDTGQFYWGTTEAFLTCGSIFQDNAAPVIIPRHLAQDIDTAEDWDRAELIFNMLTDRKNR